MLKKVICTLIVLLLISSCEQEWKVNTIDCREKIVVWENDFSNLFKTFTCDTYKSKDWYIINWECTSIELSWDKCLKSYTYNQKSNYKCWENEYLGYQWCLCNSWYVNINGKCTNLKCDWEWEFKKDDNFCWCNNWFNKTTLKDWKISCELTIENKILKLLPKWSILRDFEEIPNNKNHYLWIYIEEWYTKDYIEDIENLTKLWKSGTPFSSNSLKWSWGNIDYILWTSYDGAGADPSMYITWTNGGTGRVFGILITWSSVTRLYQTWSAVTKSPYYHTAPQGKDLDSNNYCVTYIK